MSPASSLKSNLRKTVLARRDALDEASRIEMSLRAAENALKLAALSPDIMQPGTIISGFLPIRSEIDARPLLSGLASRGARLCLPVVTSRTAIEFREFVRDAPLVPSGFGTVGPGDDSQAVDPQILILPLSVFDRRGGRIGYGAGYYDRAIARLTESAQAPLLIGLGFALQEVDHVPMETHDVPMHAIVTEIGTLQFDGQDARKL